jgi:hypothetical protein
MGFEIYAMKYENNCTYRVARKSVNLTHSVVLMEIVRFRTASQFVSQRCALNTEDLISNNFFFVNSGKQ